MKKSLYVVVFAATLLLVQGCDSKSAKDNETASTDGTPVVKVAAVTKLTAAEKRTKIAQQKEMQAEKRRIAYAAWAKQHPTFTDSDGNVIYSKAEVDPSFAGGEEAMDKFLNDNITYPQEAQDNGSEGTVFVDFVVTKEGNVRDVHATDESGVNMDQALRDEAVRLVVSMPRWNPGRQHGKPVPVKYSIPITFLLD